MSSDLENSNPTDTKGCLVVLSLSYCSNDHMYDYSDFRNPYGYFNRFYLGNILAIHCYESSFDHDIGHRFPYIFCGESHRAKAPIIRIEGDMVRES